MSLSADFAQDALLPWQTLALGTWAGTKTTLHLYAQMLGKIRVALSPPQPNWMFTALYMSPRGFTTGAIPCSQQTLEVELDVFRSAIVMTKSDGSQRAIPLLPIRTIAAVFHDVTQALIDLGIACFISPIPQEVADLLPMHEDHRSREYDVDAVKRWFITYTATATVFERRRSHFFGRSGVQLWWGAFDIALLLFSGKRVAPPLDRGYLMRYDLDAELLNVGLYLGDEQNAPFFYGYLYPEPEGAASALSGLAAAAWSTTLHEWTLPYESVRTAEDPEALLISFIDAVYDVAVHQAGWNRSAFAYDPPTRPISVR